jgi:nucleoid-associated protein YgaU
VAEKFYGDATHWKKIRDVNRANIDPDGRIRVGQVIVVP